MALVFAMVGSAVAGTDGLSNKITKSKVKKIAKKQINKAAPGLSVAHADTADTATTATNADTGRERDRAERAAGVGQDADRIVGDRRPKGGSRIRRRVIDLVPDSARGRTDRRLSRAGRGAERRLPRYG